MLTNLSPRQMGSTRTLGCGGRPAFLTCGVVTAPNGYGCPMDQDTAQSWLDAYVDAWRTYDPEQIRAFFSEDVVYRYHAYDEPVVGADAVVASWLGESDAEGVSTRDAPGTYDAEFTPFAVDGDTVVASGVTRYRREPGGPVERVYDNCFLMRFDDQRRCREFTEYYVRRPSAGTD